MKRKEGERKGQGIRRDSRALKGRNAGKEGQEE